MASQSRKHRDTSRMGGLRLPPAHERIMAKVVVTESGCWEYPTNITAQGYARLTVNGRPTLVHRFMYEHYHGPIPEGYFVCHKCDNRPCCNPGHLFAGSATDNNRDMYSKGRGVKVTPPTWRKIPLERVPEIVERFKAGERKLALADEYRVTRQAIHYLLRREGAA